MRRRYSSNATKRCDDCHKQLQVADLNNIKVIQSANISNDFDYTEKVVCDDCLNSNYRQCCHDEEHYNRPNLIDIENQDCLIIDDDYYCQYCADTYVTKCCNCDQYVDKDSQYTYKSDDGDYYCEDCYNDQFWTCDHCGHQVRRDDTQQTYDGRGNEIFVCQDCLDEFTQKCSNCGQLLHKYKDECFWTYDDQPICTSCYQNYYFYCAGCDYIYHRDDEAGYNDYGSYCRDCWREQGGRQVIKDRSEVDPQEQDEPHQYDYGTKIKPKLKKRLNEQETNEYIGVQLQLNNANDDVEQTTEFINQVSKVRKLICKEDASLNGQCGVEINTFPCTYNYHLKSFGWQRVFNIINEYDMTNTSGCGLHFHISKNYFTADQQKALDYFVNNCTSTLGAIGGRDYTNNSYCTAVPDKKQWGYNQHRHQAVNFNNSNTVELRFPKATSVYNVFKKRLRMVHNIAKLAKFFSFDDLKAVEQKDLTYLFEEMIKQL